MANRDKAFRELEEKLLGALTEYQRALYQEFVAAREEVLGRYRYTEAARRDLEEASSHASELRKRLEGLYEETGARVSPDALVEADLRVERAVAAEDLARAEGLARAAEAVLSRPEFAFRDHAECQEKVSELAREAVEESERLKNAVVEAFERGINDIREAGQ
jgi:hypothetical protein